MVWSRHLGSVHLTPADASGSAGGPAAAELWVVRGLGYQVPHGAAVAVTNGPFASTSSCDGVDQVDGLRVVAVFHNVFIVVEPGQELDFGWLVNPGAGNAGVDVSGYLLPFP